MSMAKTKPASRSHRWAAPQPEAVRRTPPQPLRAGQVSRISVNREAEAVSAGRAAAAAVTAAAQARKAALRIDEARARGKRLATLAALVGGAGLAGNLCTMLLPVDAGLGRGLLTAAATLCLAVPLALAALRAVRDGSDAEVEAATAAEAAQRTAGFAKRIGDAVAAAADAMGLSPTALVVLAPLLDAIEADAAASRRREQMAGDWDAAAGGRPLRVKPTYDRVVVTAADGRKLTARVADLSPKGVALATDLPGVGVGSTVVIGARKALAVRKFAKGMAFQFETPLPEAGFGVDVVL